MAHQRVDRRTFMTGLAGTVAMASSPVPAVGAGRPGSIRTDTSRPAGRTTQSPKPRIRFAVIGINHNHINSQVGAVLRGGGELVWLYAKEPALVADFQKRFPQVKLARTEAEVLQDPSIQLVLTSGIPVERAPLGVRVMRHGKDFMSDKPGMTTIEQLAEVRRVQAETGRIYSIMYSERLENRATVRAAQLVKAGAIGKIVQTVGLGPHRIAYATRPAWFWEKSQFGGILCDIASHQADQFLHFTGSTRADVVSSQVGNVHYPDRPNFEDFGDMVLRGDSGTGYVRVDWFTPNGLSTWGDGRLTVLGTEGFIEVRKNIDIAGRSGDSHLFIVDQKETRYIDCATVEMPYGTQLVDDVINRTETAMPQAQCFLAMELVLKAEQQAQRLTFRA